MPRLFVGVELESEPKHAAAAASDALRQAIARARIPIAARWVPFENLHITLWFIGEVSDDRARSVHAALAPPFPLPPFSIGLAGFGAFPAGGAPRVLWMGLVEGLDHLRALYAETGRRLAPLGFEPEHREYSAHLTLARVKDGPPRPTRDRFRQLLRDATVHGGRSRVTAVTLFRSRLSPKGATYEPSLRVPLE
jgi:2'-5' RNA ligase